MFAKLNIHNWRQFEQVEIDFHPRLTVLTGANGSGKTTLLHLLNRHWGWDLKFVSSPRPSGKELRKYWAGFWGNGENGEEQQKPAVATHTIGELTYKNKSKATLRIPGNVAEVFSVIMHPQMGEVNGVYVPSHRPPYIFQKIEAIPVKLDAKEQIFQVYLAELMSRFTGSHIKNSPSFQIKRSLMSLATFGYGNVAVEGNEEAVRMFEDFQKILRILLPVSLGFRQLKVRVPDILLATESGEFAFEAVSGGIAAIIDMAWQIFMYSQLHDEFVVVIDEPEAHLHPALQQRLLPDMLKAFPRSQFIIATHNPFMVTSVPDSNVFVLRYNAENRVVCELLDAVNKAGTADEILMDVLGVPYTLPQWASKQIEGILKEFIKAPLTKDTVASLKSKMAGLGMDHLFPEVLAKVAEGQR